MSKHNGSERSAELVFAVFAAQSQPRSLRRLATELPTAGVRISPRTLSRWSAKYRWRQRLAAIDAQATALADFEAVSQLRVLLGRHSQLGRALLGLASTATQQLLTDPGRLRALPPTAIARLGEVGARLERGALGEKLQVEQAVVTTLNVVTTALADAFLQANALPHPEERARVFGAEADALLRKYVKDAGFDGIEMAGPHA